MDGMRARVARLLYQLGAIKFGAFKLKLHEKNPNAPLSPIYLALRTDDHPTNPGTLTPEAMEMIGQLMADKVADIEFDHFVGIPEAGEPFADALEKQFAKRANAPTRLKLRKETLDDGSRSITDNVEGDFQKGDTVLLTDDLLTQADTKLEAIAALEGQGLIVTHVLVLVDRGQGGKEQLEEAGYTLIAIYELDGELLHFYVEEDFIQRAKARQVSKYLRANRVTSRTPPPSVG